MTVFWIYCLWKYLTFFIKRMKEWIQFVTSVTEPNLGLLTYFAAKLFYWHQFWWRDAQHLFAGCQAGKTGSPWSKDSDSLTAFRGGLLKKPLWVRVTAHGLFSDWSVVLLMININILAPTSLGSTVSGQLIVSILHLVDGGLRFLRTTQRYVLERSVYPLRGN